MENFSRKKEAKRRIWIFRFTQETSLTSRQDSLYMTLCRVSQATVVFLIRSKHCVVLFLDRISEFDRFDRDCDPSLSLPSSPPPLLCFYWMVYFSSHNIFVQPHYRSWTLSAWGILAPAEIHEDSLLHAFYLLCRPFPDFFFRRIEMSAYVKIPTMFTDNDTYVEEAGDDFENEGARPSSAPPLFSQAKEGSFRSGSFSSAKERTLIESGVEDIRTKPNYPEFYEKNHHLFNLPPPFDPTLYKFPGGKQERHYVDEMFNSVRHYLDRL